MVVESQSVRPPTPAPPRRERAGPQPGVSVGLSSHLPGVRCHAALPGPRVRSPRSASPAIAPPVSLRHDPGWDRGVSMLLVFTAATLLMVVAVTVVAIVDRWWVLVPVMLVDFAATCGVIVCITRLLADDGESPGP